MTARTGQKRIYPKDLLHMKISCSQVSRKLEKKSITFDTNNTLLESDSDR